MDAARPARGPLCARPAARLAGRVSVPGDKSISHRALILGALAVGETRIAGLLEGDDVLATAAALRALGAWPVREAPGRWRVHGCGIGGLAEPSRVLDMGNSGTGARLLMGVAAGHGFTTFLTGDASLCRRPMARVMDPLAAMGASFRAAGGARLPLAVTGRSLPLPLAYRLPVPSAQVKSAVLLAGLHAQGTTTTIEDRRSRDHTERMLAAFGAPPAVEECGGRVAVSVEGGRELVPASLRVPADPSSAAFAAAAAAALPGSAIALEGVGVNPLRTGLFETLGEMGAPLRFENRRREGGEPVADIVVEGAPLRGVEVPPARAPAMIDDYPALAVAAACAEGATAMRGLAELRVKESDRLAAMAAGLTACGVAVEAQADGLVVHGAGGRPPGGATVPAGGDHRIAMAFLALGLVARQGVQVDETAAIATSFPGFAASMARLGAVMAPPGSAGGDRREAAGP